MNVITPYTQYFRKIYLKAVTQMCRLAIIYMSLNLRTVYQANHVLSFYWLVLLYTLLYTYHIILQLNLSVLL